MPSDRPSGRLCSLLGSRSQRRRWGEPVAVPRRELVGPGHETGDTTRVLLDVLGNPAGPRREADAEDRADVGVRRGRQDPLVEALDRLERLGEQHPLLRVDEGDSIWAAAEVLDQTWPQPESLALLVVIEAGARAAPLATELLDHPIQDGVARMVGEGAARCFDRCLRLLTDLPRQRERQLVEQLQRGRRV